MYAKLEIGNRHILEWGSRTYIMGIINVTPDSFSGDGLLAANSEQSQDWVNLALTQARQFVAAGADILDVGGESTRPGSAPVDTGTEMERVIPVIRAISAEFNILISIDTYRSETAAEALRAGAHMVNDVWGLRVDPKLAEVAARFHAPVILMHNRSSWAHAEIKERLGGRYVGVPYDNLLEDVKRELLESVALAHEAGVQDERIILDPGIGFGKTVEQNLELIDRLDEVRALGYPVLLGPSRKSFIGYTLNLPPEERLEGTLAAAVIGVARGADILRVHDVMPTVRSLRMADAILRR